MSKAKHIIMLIDEIVQDRDKLKEVLPSLSDQLTPSGLTIKGVLYKLSKDRKLIDSLREDPDNAVSVLVKRFKEVSKGNKSCAPCLTKFLKALDIDVKESDFG